MRNPCAGLATGKQRRRLWESPGGTEGKRLSLTLIWVALLFAALDWAAVARGWKALRYIAKPAVMVCLIAWLGVNGGWSGVLLWFTAGLLFSLAGDIFLMLPKERFTAGLAAFLLAHLAYIIGLNTNPLPVNIASLIVLALVGLTSTTLYLRICAGAGGDGGPQAQDTRAGIHAGAQPDALLGAAHLRAPGVVARGGAAGGVGGGGLSTSRTACWRGDKFVSPLRHGELLVMITYHLGQVMITLGAALNFL